MKIRKAVFPVAGLGTRFLPATKAMAKEMHTSDWSSDVCSSDLLKKHWSLVKMAVGMIPILPASTKSRIQGILHSLLDSS